MSNSLDSWFERRYLEWQLNQGSRKSVQEFADFLGISQPYLTQLMNGNRDGMRPGTAYMIARKLQDYSLLDILGLAYPVEDIPDVIANPLRKSQEEISNALHGMDVNTPEARAIAIAILEKHGFKFVQDSLQ